MKCKYKNDYILFADYITGKLSETERAELETHLFECEQCRQKADAVEKASWVIHLEGQTFLDKQPAATLIEELKDFFGKLSIFKLPKLVYIGLLLGLTLGTGSLTLYTSDIDSVYTLTVNENSLSGMRSSAIDPNSSVQQRAFEQFISEGQSAFMQGKYHKALDIYEKSQDFLEDSTVVDNTYKVQQCKLEYSLGVTKTMLWQSQPPGYFEWLILKTRKQQFDTSLLREAQTHLAKALHLSRELSKANRTASDKDQQEEQRQNQRQTTKIILDEKMVSALLSSIRDKTNS